jgi:trk system potassium uptake protein TrkA
MKIIICGAGQVGWQIARYLSRENNDVVVVDNNPDLVRRATDTLDVQGVAGFASYPAVLKRAGADDAEMIIAATHSDEVNMVTCQIAHSVFNVRRKVARLRSTAYLDAIYSDMYRQDHLPIDVVISPEREVAAAAMLRLSNPAAFETELFMDGRAQLLGITIDEGCPVVNTPLHQLTDLFSTLRGVVVGISREGRLFAPERSDQLFVGDSAYLFVDVNDVGRMLEVFGKSQKPQERVVILGAGNVGLEVAKALENSGKRIRAKVIERDRKRAEFAAEELERTIVLHGDGLDADMLAEAGIDRADAMLAITDDDKTNLLAAVRAKNEGCHLAIALINDPSLVPLMNSLNIDAYINPRATTVSSILRHIRTGKVHAVYSVGDSEAELIEAEVLSTSPMAGHRLRDIDFPEGTLLGGVLRAKEFLRPSSDLVIEAGDVVAIFSMTDDVAEVERLFQVSIDFF